MNVVAEWKKTDITKCYINPNFNSFEIELLDMIPNIKFIDFGLIKNLDTGELGDDVHIEISILSTPNFVYTSYIPKKNLIIIATTLPSITHEISHMVEMNDFSRLIKDDWGLWNNINNPSAKALICSIAREVRVRAIETHINTARTSKNLIGNAGGINLSIRDLNKLLPYGKFKNQKEIEVWALDMFEKTQKDWNKDRIHFEWSKRIDYIRNWQETKDA